MSDLSESPSFEVLSEESNVTDSSPSDTLSPISIEQQESSSPAEQQPEQDSESTPTEPTVVELVEPLFSICIICANGEATLPRLAKSIEHFMLGGGQVVLLDTGSTDNTIEVAKNLGFEVHVAEKKFTATMSKHEARTLLEKWCDAKEANRIPFRQGASCFYFSEARNAVAALAKTDMVLQLDASDECYSMDVNYLNTLISGGFNSIYYSLSNKIEGQVAEGIASANRFYDRRLQKWEGRAHEELYAVDGKAGPQIRMIQTPTQALDVIHWRQSSKIRDGYLLGCAMDVFYFQHNAQIIGNFGRQLYYAGFEASALKVLTKHLTMEFSLTARRSLSACFIGQIYVKQASAEQSKVKAEIERLKTLKREPDERTVLEMAKRVTKLYDQAREAYFSAFQLDCSWRAPVMALSDIALRTNDYDRAIFWAKAASTIRRTSMISEDVSLYQYAIDETLMKSYYGLWAKALKEKASNANDLYFEARSAWERLKESYDWLASVKKFSEIFELDVDFAGQSVQTGDFKDK